VAESARRFSAVGACIYCGASGDSARLSDEHIVPYALNGKGILPAASCSDCAKETAKFEGRLTRGVFLPIRLQGNFRTRRPKERPSKLPMYDVVEGGFAPINPEYVPIDMYPAFHTLPEFERPGILAGEEPAGEFKNVRLHAWWPPDLQSRLGHLKAAGMKKKSLSGFLFNDFVRLIAKIAHGVAVANYGHASFHPFLLETILNRSTSAAYYIGGTGERLPEKENETHRVTTAIHHVDEKVLLVVTIRLFAFMHPPAPIYVVVAGEFPPRTFFDLGMGNPCSA